MSFKYWAVISLTFFTGCLSTTNILEIGRDTYSVSVKADGYRLTSLARARASELGSAKCSSFGKHFLFIDESATRTHRGIDTTITITFKCLNEYDLEYLVSTGFNSSPLGA